MAKTMETNTKTPQNIESGSRPEEVSVAQLEAMLDVEQNVPQSPEVARYEAQQSLEGESVAPAGYEIEIAIPASTEVATRTDGEVVPFGDKLPAVNEAVDALASVQGEELALVEEHLKEQGVATVPERNLKAMAESGSEEPEHDSLLFLSGQEAEKPYAVKVGKETRIMKVLELYKYLMTVRETVPNVSVVDAKGNVLMSAKGEIAQAVLDQTLIMQMAMKAVGLARIENPSGTRVEMHSGTVAAQQEASLPAATETPAEISAPQANGVPSAGAATMTSDTEAAGGDSTEGAMAAAEAPGTEMEIYDGERTEANAQVEQAAQETGPAAIESAEAKLANGVLDDLLPSGRISVEEARQFEQQARNKLAKEKIHPDVPDSGADEAYAAVKERLEEAVGGRIDRGL